MKPDLGYVSKASGQIELYKANHTGEIKGVSLTVRTCKNVKTIPDHQFGELYYHKDTSSKRYCSVNVGLLVRLWCKWVSYTDINVILIISLQATDHLSERKKIT
jgi:hypothetical protein